MRTLDFNAIMQPTWEIKLKDAAKTVVHLVAPTVELVDRLSTVAPELQKVAEAKDGRTTKAVYDLIADILSCNDDGYTFTAEELRDKYRMSLIDVAKFTSMYFEFLNEIKDAKN